MFSAYGPTDDSPKYVTDQVTEAVTQIIRYAPPFFRPDEEPLAKDEPAMLILRRTCFYAEAGGQIGDRGQIVGPSLVFEVQDTQRVGSVVMHSGTLAEGELRVGDVVELRVDALRTATKKNHTATHVMNWALREVLGDHVQQKGSLVDPDKTRFDFSHPRPMTPEEIERVEALVNERIAQKLPVDWDEKVPLDVALSINGVRAVFGEKYPDPVRMVCCGVAVEKLRKDPAKAEWREFPIELCGGTHCKSTGEIECFAIVSEEAVAKGIRRVVGITGDAAQRAIETGTELLQRADALRRAGTAHHDVAAGGSPADQNRDRKGAVAGADSHTDPGARKDSRTSEEECRVGTAHQPDELVSHVAELQKAADETTMRVVDRVKLREAIGELQQLIKKQQKKQAAEALDVVNARIDELLRSPTKIGNTTVIVAEMPDVPIDQLKNGADRIKQKCKSAAVLFGVVQEATAETDSRGDWGARKDSRTSGVPPADTARRAVAHRPSEPEAQARDKRSGAKALLLAAMTPDLVKKGLKAGDLVKHLAPLIDGRGGGPPTMAQAGGKNPEKLPEALTAGLAWIRERLR